MRDKAGRFTKGYSGNADGRPKVEIQNTNTDFRDASEQFQSRLMHSKN
jgi:hypothetical protein